MALSVSAQVSDEERVMLARERLGESFMGKWQLESVLGIGGMASVFAARHRNGSRVAIKILHPELAPYADVRERFIEEGFAANDVGHPGVVRVLDDGQTEDGLWYLVMDLLQGETLEQKRKRGPIAPREVLEICDQVLDVLVAAHRQGVVHRDIKPENIFIAQEGVKLFDFGIARRAESGRTHATQPGSTLGTPAFMPPEQARGRLEDVDARSDLWAVGATLFWVLSGELPRKADTLNEELLAAMTTPVPPLASVCGGLSHSVTGLIDKAVRLDKAERWSSAAEMQQQVRRILADPELVLDVPALAASTSALSPTPSIRPLSHTLADELRPRRRLVASALTFIGLLVVLALLAATVFREEPAAGGSDPSNTSAAAAASPRPNEALLQPEVIESESVPRLDSVPIGAEEHPTVRPLLEQQSADKARSTSASRAPAANDERPARAKQLQLRSGTKPREEATDESANAEPSDAPAWDPLQHRK